ncbi:MAG: class I SAM-dependent methyltransferase [Bacteroidota bacterium]
MLRKLPIHLESIQKTLLLPLWGRAVETQKEKPLLIDKTAVEIIDKIDYDFSRIARNISSVSQIAWIARSLHIDRTIKDFLQKHPAAAIVNIGCGLDTTFDRVDNGILHWYDLDLPDVIALRKEFIRESERRTFLINSFLDDAWLHQLEIVDGIMFVAAGVFYYFEENEIKKFFINLADAFPEGEIIFDASLPLGVKVANKKVIEDGGMDKSGILRWGLETAKSIQQWDPRFMLVDEYRIFKNIKRGLNFKNIVGTFFSDILNIMLMVHLKFSNHCAGSNGTTSSAISDQ